VQNGGYGSRASEENVHSLDRGLLERGKYSRGFGSTGTDVEPWSAS